ncbi:hypothetical protein B0J11DRAFT_586877 [Dendryphion nanum]|uniref:Uncharacterized protein n=1 Tax=Dendryphion nanum TaxID=256645 RepID=A0A9P9I5K0_9PLEO|nr:hypothetical protein B0J11DRAFT_586877 [Dendryphion nanum]
MTIFHRSLLVVAAALASLASATNVPEDVYQVTNLGDGTASWQSVTNTSAPAIIVTYEATLSTKARSAKFAKRTDRTDCWGHMLNRGDTDSALQGLRQWAGSGRDLSSGPGPYYLTVKRGDMIAYYCITRGWQTGNLHIDDVNHAIRKMDEKCRPYEASWYGWDGGLEIVGKSRIQDQVCIGPF